MLVNLQGKPQEKASTSLSRLQWWAYSLPLFLKMLGIVVLVSTIFGGVVYFQVRGTIRRAHDRMHLQNATRAADSLVSSLERLDLTRDTPVINEALDGILKIFPDISYILVLDEKGKVLAHYFGFPTEIPLDLPERATELCTACHEIPEVLNLPSDLVEVATLSHPGPISIRRFSRPMGKILEATGQISDGDGGVVRVGYGDASIMREMGPITGALIRSLLICLVLGQCLALGMTYLLVHPILNLVQATNAIGAGDFAARAKVYSADEIGRLARVFNLMAGKLQQYQTEVNEKEAFRASLLDQIVQAQEEERVSVARELHDQLGQSLYRTLLLHQDLRRDCGVEDCRHDELEEHIRGLIDEVRRLAWGIRPSALDDFGLDSALQQYTKETANRAGIPIDYKCGLPPDQPRLPSRVEVILYRVAQEAITNVIRHANASRASVILLRYDSEVTLLVEDDGQGFDTQAVAQGDISSLGLTGMRERVALAGGILTIDSRAGKGAVIRVRIPVGEHS